MNSQPPREKRNARNAASLGTRLREVRRQRGITLKQVAEAVGVTESFVSQVERGTANPSVATLRRMAEALGETVASLFVGAGPTGMVVRAGERRRLHHPSGSDTEYLLTPPSAKTLEIVYATLEAGAGSGDEPYSHAADEECVIVIAGRLDVGVNGELHHLDTGDALLLDPKLPHSYHNPGPGNSTTIWVMSPPGY
jgi:transcriptional regulator with XRE-family HTH domain